MFKFEKGDIYITKGDSCAIEFELTKSDGSIYSMAAGDSLKMTVKKKMSSSAMMTVTSSTNTLDITHALSSALEVGPCFYDIQLATGAGDIFTLFGPTDNYCPNMMVYPELTE